MKRLQHALFLCFLTLASLPSQASDIIAGFISAEQVQGLEYEITVTTWTNDWHQPSFKRCAVDLVVFYNNTPSNLLNVPRINGGPQPPNSTCPPSVSAQAGETVKGPIRKNIYQTRYTFPGAGTAQVVFQSIGREININNILRPGFTNFSVETEFQVYDGGQQNSTPVLDAELLQAATANSTFNFSGYVSEPDAGDSLAYSARIPSAVNSNNYTALSSIGGAYSVDAGSGAASWSMPQTPGFYLASIRIDHFRNGQNMGYSYLDYLIEVDQSVGIEDEFISTFSLSPNPVQDRVSLQFSLPTAGTAVQLRLLDIHGRAVHLFPEQSLAAGNQSLDLQLPPALANGIYLMELRHAEGVRTEKLVIRR
jgi:hypothetical protein